MVRERDLRSSRIAPRSETPQRPSPNKIRSTETMVQPKFPPWGLAMPSKVPFEQDHSVLTTWSKTPVVTNSTGYALRRINPIPE